MIIQLALAFGLLAACVCVHGTVVTVLLRRLETKPANLSLGRSLWLMIRVATNLIVAHIVEIVLWGAVSSWRNVFPDLETSLYFSAVTYTTVGYGDLVPPQPWRLAAGIEGLTGILMCGWSAAYFFTVVTRMEREP